MSIRFRRLAAFGAVLALVLAACTDTTNPGDGTFDAQETSASLETVDAAFGTAAFESFAVLGPHFTVGGAAAASAEWLEGYRDADSRTMSEQAESIAQQLAAAMAPAAVLIPDDYWGVYVFVPGEGYVVNPDAGTPVDGARFTLYAINPVTKEIAEPLNAIGYADLIDESTELTASVRLRVVSGEVTYLDYTVSTTGPITAPVFVIDGYVTDGSNLAEFTLSVSFVFTFAGSSVDIDYDIDVNDAHIAVVLHMESEGEGEDTGTIEVTFTHDGGSVRVVGEMTNGLGEFEVLVGNDLFATISITESTITVLGADLEPLSQEETEALRRLMEMVEDVMDTFEELFNPVEFLFGG